MGCQGRALEYDKVYYVYLWIQPPETGAESSVATTPNPKMHQRCQPSPQPETYRGTDDCVERVAKGPADDPTNTDIPATLGTLSVAHHSLICPSLFSACSR